MYIQLPAGDVSLVASMQAAVSIIATTSPEWEAAINLVAIILLPLTNASLDSWPVPCGQIGYLCHLFTEA